MDIKRIKHLKTWQAENTAITAFAAFGLAVAGYFTGENLCYGLSAACGVGSAYAFGQHRRAAAMLHHAAMEPK